MWIESGDEDLMISFWVEFSSVFSFLLWKKEYWKGFYDDGVAPSSFSTKMGTLCRPQPKCINNC